MKKILLVLLILNLTFQLSFSQDTFSIIAIDTITGEIGGAGASCIDETAIPTGVLIINDVIAGRGGIHTQASWLSANQQNAHNRMVEGFSPQEIISWLVANDAQNNPSVRQYGIVDLDSLGHPRSAAYTGANCYNYKNHINGPNYSIQGNILLGQHILDSIESRFLAHDGPLAEKLMFALQGANIPGADTRCLTEGTSSRSSFIRVAKADVQPGQWWCDLLVPSTPYGVEPIDSLQVLFDQWLLWTNSSITPFIQPNRAKVYPNPAKDSFTVGIEKTTFTSGLLIQLLSGDGKALFSVNYYGKPVSIPVASYPAGLYFYRVMSDAQILDAGKIYITK